MDIIIKFAGCANNKLPVCSSDWKNYTDPACSFPRGRMSPPNIMGARLRDPLIALKHHGTMVSRGLRGALKCASIMPRGVSLSENGGEFF